MAASRPTARAITNISRNARQLHMTGPTTFPSAILTETRTTDSSPTEALRRPKLPSSETPAALPRHFNTSRALKAVGDTSTIDFAYLPESEQDIVSDVPTTRIPLLLSTMYSGVTARAMHEETPEVTLRPMINLISGSETYVSAPSAMSEVLDNNAIEFEGISSEMATSKSEDVDDGSAGRALKAFWTGLVDDVMGPKKS